MIFWIIAGPLVCIPTVLLKFGGAWLCLALIELDNQLAFCLVAAQEFMSSLDILFGELVDLFDRDGETAVDKLGNGMLDQGVAEFSLISLVATPQAAPLVPQSLAQEAADVDGLLHDSATEVAEVDDVASRAAASRFWSK